MRCLVVEDDNTTRRLLCRLISSSFGLEVSEAANGMDALLAIESSPPDLVVTDVGMPVLDGLGLVTAIRGSPATRGIPVVVVSGSAERAAVAQLIELGIEDYLLKPLDIAAATKRLSRVVSELRARPAVSVKPARTADGEARPLLLLVDPDPNFRSLFKTLLAGCNEVIEAGSGPQGLAAAAERSPPVVVLTEGLGLLNEWQLLGRLRALPCPPEVYLVHGATRPKDADRFDGVFQKTFVPETLASRWREVSVRNDAVAALNDALTGPMRAEVVSATQQTFGVMVGEEVNQLSDDEAGLIDAEVVSMARLATAEGKVGLEIAIATTAAEASQLATPILGESVSWGDGASEAIGTLVETVAGRVRSSFDSRSIRIDQTGVGPVPPGDLGTTSAFRTGFAMASGARFVLHVSQAFAL